MILAADRGLSMRSRWLHRKRPIGVEMGKLTPDNVRAQLELLDERRFRNGVVHLRYCVSV